MSLYISINTASNETADSPIDKAITFMAAHAAIEKQSGRLPDGPKLDVTFLIPGEYKTPPFTGMRMGGYTKESNTLFFETAVPNHILKSDDAPVYVSVVMQEVVEHAQEFFLEHKINFDTNQWRVALQNILQTENASLLTH